MTDLDVHDLLKDHDRSLKSISEAMSKIAQVQADHDKSIIRLSTAMEKIADKIDDITNVIKEDRQSMRDIINIVSEHQHYKPMIIERLTKLETEHNTQGCVSSQKIELKLANIGERLNEIEGLKNKLLYSVVGLVGLAAWDIFMKFKG